TLLPLWPAGRLLFRAVRLMSPRGRSRRYSILRKLRRLRYVRFGTKADICGATSHVRFTPNCDCKSGNLRFVMSALPPKADICGATRDVRFGPKADIVYSITS